MTIDDVLAEELNDGRPVLAAVEGDPYESWHVISDDGRVGLGIWAVTHGSFRARRRLLRANALRRGRGDDHRCRRVVTEIRPVSWCFARHAGPASGSERDDPEDPRGREDALGSLSHSAQNAYPSVTASPQKPYASVAGFIWNLVGGRDVQ
jgi:hypothetical protein